MKKFDVVIIGAGCAGHRVATELANEKSVLLIALPGAPEDYFRDLVTALSGQPSRNPAAEFPSHPAKTPPRFLNSRTVELDGEQIEAKHFVIASGCGPRVPAAYGAKHHVTPLNILNSPASDGAATIVGGGPVGVATAAKLAKQGAKVKLLINSERILPKEDADIASGIQSWLEALGVGIEKTAGMPAVDNVILATGLQPNTAGMDLPKAGVYLAADGAIAVDEEFRTPNHRIHAAGAVTGPVFNLAYEDFQAETIAENIPAAFFNRVKLSPDPIPALIPLDPPFARIGLTETDAMAKRRGVLSLTSLFPGGRIKLVGLKKSTELLGVHIFAPGADALITYFDLIIRAGIQLREVAETHHHAAPGPSAFAYQAITEWLEKTN